MARSDTLQIDVLVSRTLETLWLNIHYREVIMITTDAHYRTQAPQLDLFQENLDRLLAEGVGVRNPELIARKARREAAYTEALRMIHDATLQNVVLHAKMQKLARELEKT